MRPSLSKLSILAAFFALTLPAFGQEPDAAAPPPPAAPEAKAVPVPDPGPAPEPAAMQAERLLDESRKALAESHELLMLAKADRAAAAAALVGQAKPSATVVPPPSPAAPAANPGPNPLAGNSQEPQQPVMAPGKAAPQAAAPAVVQVLPGQQLLFQVVQQPAPSQPVVTNYALSLPPAAGAASLPAEAATVSTSGKVKPPGPIRRGVAGLGDLLSHAGDTRVVSRIPRTQPATVQTVVQTVHTVAPAPAVAAPAPAPAPSQPVMSPVSASAQSAAATTSATTTQAPRWGLGLFRR
jgi:hypothetical protein